jgi:UDP-N-acetylmuramoylalanine--D-glutamate ligase
VTLADDAPARAVRSRVGEHDLDLPLFTGDGTPGSSSLPQPISHWDLLVVSPGVPCTHPRLAEAADAEVPVLSELEIGARFIRGRLVAITGTNGKTTTASLTAHLLGGEERSVFLAGNVGRPICDAVQRPAARASRATLVVEVSSFQCEHLERFHPHVAVVLNLRPDHLDRHGRLEAYQRAKAQMGKNLTDDDLLITPHADPAVEAVVKDWRGRRVDFSPSREVRPGCFFLRERFQLNQGGEDIILADRDDLRLPGEHSVANALAALAAAHHLGVDPDTLAERLRTFQPVPHRIEHVLSSGGVAWYNDSKATNLDALRTALTGFRRVVLIAGGRSKGEDCSALRDLIAERVRHLVLLGEEAQAMEQAWGDLQPVTRVDGLPEAVREAHRLSRRGDVVLLSPGCPSFDMFRDYEDRGTQFREAVLAEIADSESNPQIGSRGSETRTSDRTSPQGVRT